MGVDQVPPPHPEERPARAQHQLGDHRILQRVDHGRRDQQDVREPGRQRQAVRRADQPDVPGLGTQPRTRRGVPAAGAGDRVRGRQPDADGRRVVRLPGTHRRRHGRRVHDARPQLLLARRDHVVLVHRTADGPGSRRARVVGDRRGSPTSRTRQASFGALADESKESRLGRFAADGGHAPHPADRTQGRRFRLRSGTAGTPRHRSRGATGRHHCHRRSHRRRQEHARQRPLAGSTNPPPARS